MRALEEFTGGAQELVAGLGAAQHSRDFGWPIDRLERSDAAAGRPPPFALFDHEVTIRKSRNLRQMGHAKNLMVARELVELAPDNLRDSAAYSRVDLVEDHRGYATMLRLEPLEREH